MKKILIVGAGAQGNVVGWVLSKAPEVGRITLADLDARRAEETARSIGGDKIRTERVDVTNVEETAGLIRRGGYDLVVNVAPPQFIPHVMKATLDADRDYLDLSSVSLYETDGLPFEQMQFADRWKASGRTALINGGSAPGLTNIMAREGADLLDEVDRIEIKEAFLLSFATASSEAAYPKILDALDRFGVRRKISSFVMPMGYSFNLDGSMMYCTFAVLFIAQAYDIHLSIGTQLTMLLILMLTSKGMAGVPRASLVVIAATLNQFNIPEAGLLLILGVDTFLDMGRSATNAVGNSIATAVVAKWENELLPAAEAEANARTLDTAVASAAHA